MYRTEELQPSSARPSCAEPLEPYARFSAPHPALSSKGKRMVDILLAVALLLLFAWAFLAIALLVASTTGSPVLYRHQRVGANGRRFYVMKFRSMLPNAEILLAEHLANNESARLEWSRDFKLRNDPRVTNFGRFLRRTSLDELPQLWNVLKGEMTFVGPRPVTATELDTFYGNRVYSYMSVKPGITGLWQVNGRSLLSYSDRVAMDIAYVERWSFKQDLAILLKTVAVVLRGTGSH